MITRRTALTAAAAASAAPLLGSVSAHAAPPPKAGSQAPSFFRYKLGDLEITAVGDGFLQRPLDGFVRNVDVADVKKTLTAQGLPDTHIRVPYTTLVVNTGSKLIVFDTGNGEFAPAATTGHWMKNFRAAGFAPEMVDTVVLSHFHGDHINGLRKKDGTATFPNAEVMVPEAEYAFWMDEARMNNAPEAMKGAFRGVHFALDPIAKDVKRFAWDKEILPGITTVRAEGHTPGHTAFVLASGKETMMFVADITNTPLLFARHPEWQVMFDMDPAQAITTRKRILDMASADRIRCAFYHGPFPSAGQVSKDGAGYRLDLIPLQDAI